MGPGLTPRSTPGTKVTAGGHLDRHHAQLVPASTRRACRMGDSRAAASLHPVPPNVPSSCANSRWGQCDGDRLQWDLSPPQCWCHHAGVPRVVAGWPPWHRAPCLAGTTQSHRGRRARVGAKHRRVPQMEEQLREQRDASRTQQAQAASAPPAAAPRGGTARGYGDHSSIKRQSCAPSLVLAADATNGPVQLCKASGGNQARSRESPGRAPSQPGVASPQHAQGVSLGGCGDLSPLCQSPHSLSPLSPPEGQGFLLESAQATLGISPRPAPTGAGMTRALSGPLPTHSSTTCCLLPACPSVPGRQAGSPPPPPPSHHSHANSRTSPTGGIRGRHGWPRGFRGRTRAHLVWPHLIDLFWEHTLDTAPLGSPARGAPDGC